MAEGRDSSDDSETTATLDKSFSDEGIGLGDSATHAVGSYRCNLSLPLGVRDGRHDVSRADESTDDERENDPPPMVVYR